MKPHKKDFRFFFALVSTKFVAMRFLILLSITTIFFSCTNTQRVRVEKRVVVDSAWHQENPNGIPPDIEGKNKVLVDGNVLTTQRLMRKGDSITFYYYK
jgi:hypothetical protein